LIQPLPRPILLGGVFPGRGRLQTVAQHVVVRTHEPACLGAIERPGEAGFHVLALDAVDVSGEAGLIPTVRGEVPGAQPDTQNHS
jgi:hypothetical protein